jgi:hypothetical protein
LSAISGLADHGNLNLPGELSQPQQAWRDVPLMEDRRVNKPDGAPTST